MTDKTLDVLAVEIAAVEISPARLKALADGLHQGEIRLHLMASLESQARAFLRATEGVRAILAKEQGLPHD